MHDTHTGSGNTIWLCTAAICELIQSLHNMNIRTDSASWSGIYCAWEDCMQSGVTVNYNLYSCHSWSCFICNYESVSIVCIIEENEQEQQPCTVRLMMKYMKTSLQVIGL